ncbi:MAG: helix-turn-helix transcriptional regulator [Ktedonobacteraceae bacterium]|nr:helix-turn-helix transcriptional regulator [Ktedonobacteraceae bacterium]
MPRQPRPPALPCDKECPVRKAMDILDSKWTILIIRDLLQGKKRFGELRYSISEISPKVLAQRLHMLEQASIVTKTIYAEVPPHVEYALTQRGQGLQAVVGALAQWGETL